MTRLIKTCVAVLGSLALGCSGTSVYAIRADDSTNSKLGESDAEAKGFRYYEASPYLLVYADGKGGLETKLIYLPDPNKKRSVRPWEFLASNTTNLTFSNGVLTESKLAGDSTAIGKAGIEALKTALTAAVKGLAAAQVPTPADEADRVPVPHLYKIVVTEKGTILIEGKGVLLELDSQGNVVNKDDYILRAKPGLPAPSSGEKK